MHFFRFYKTPNKNDILLIIHEPEAAWFPGVRMHLENQNPQNISKKKRVHLSCLNNSKIIYLFSFTTKTTVN